MKTQPLHGLLATTSASHGGPKRNIVFSGHLGDVPVVAVHNEGDGLVPADHEEAYADVVHASGQGALLRQLFVHRGGHCTVTPAEVLVALQVLDRVVTGSWPVLDPAILNATVDAMAVERRLLGGRPARGAYAAFTPSAFPRRYDGRDMSRRVVQVPAEAVDRHDL